MTTTLHTEIPAHLTTDFDVYDSRLAVPNDLFQDRVAALRKQGPVLHSPHHGGHWVVTRYKEALQVLQDPETFSSHPNNLLNAAQGKFLPLELDPPEHGYYRQALQPLFSPKRMNALEPEIRSIITTLLDRFADRGECEFISEFAHELPTQIFLALMGWPLNDAPKFTEWTDITLQGVPGATEEESAKARALAAEEIYDYFGHVVASVKDGQFPSDNLTALIVNADLVMENETRPLTDEELCRMFFLMLVAGLHTVQGALAWGLIHLAGNPDQRQSIVDDPSLIPSAVEEILRIETATSGGRRATRDTEIGGVTIKEGDQLLVVMTAANRDEDEFDDPNELNIERHPNRHMGFGAGPHRCLGSHLARLELRLALEEIHRRIPDYSLIPNDPAVFHASQVRGCERLPITFTPENR